MVGHSFLQSITGRHGVAFVIYNIAGLISEISYFKSPEFQIAKNCRRRQPPRGTPANIRMHLIFPETIVTHWPAFLLLSLIVWVYLHSNLCRGLQKYTSFLHQSAFWPFKVIQDQWFWYQSKARMQLPI